MVPRLIALTGLIASIAVAAALPASADASNRRISISDYQWSDPDAHIDLGEHVTWYWTGPDLMHSVTGQSANDLQWDSDPGTNQPHHKIGDNYQLSFDKPGVYFFQCKLHSTVRGTITVSANPGDPQSEPDPVPKSNVDLRPPRLTNVHLAKRHFGRRGTNLHFSLGERGKLSADFYRYDTDGHRHYTGYSTWQGKVGYNGVRFGARRKHFRPRPGRYLAVMNAIDKSQNVTKTKRVRFVIRKR